VASFGHSFVDARRKMRATTNDAIEGRFLPWPVNDDLA
jgi:hypothetical protein